ncbi:MAG: hypothetical protein ACRELG_08790, partial [Gemmataceae bacterium]
MFRLFLTFLCSFAFALQVLVITGCGGSPTKSSPGSGGGSGSGGASTGACAPGSGAEGYGYNNRNGSVTGIWLQSPAPGENPGGNVQVNATAYATAPITQWTVCLDGQAAYQTSGAATSISHPIDIPTGQHLLWATVSD